MVLYDFGPRYPLPLPLTVFQWAGAAVVGISFIMMTVFAGHRTGPTPVGRSRRELSRLAWAPRSSALRRLGGAVGVIGLCLVVVTGLLGPGRPERSLAEFLTWVYFWAGLGIVTGLLGPVWRWLNPFLALDGLVRRVRGEAAPSPAGDALARFGLWPAAGLLFVFGCLDVGQIIGHRPLALGLFVLSYTVFTVAGMQRYGSASWLAHVEFFSVFFGLLARFAPLEVREGRVYLRPLGAGLLDRVRGGWDQVLFVILMLSTLAFEALVLTPVWSQVVASPVGRLVLQLGPPGDVGLRVLGLVALTLLFLVAFMVCMELVLYFGEVGVDGPATATAFALTLVPIAYVYDFAHNYANLVVQAQLLLPLLADPLGLGWRPLPLAGFHPSTLLASAVVVWYVEVVLIVGGHVVAMWLAHLRAGERFGATQNVLLSQYPILVLMVLYTVTSLWILAQPVARYP